MRWALGFENGPAFTSYNIARNASFHVGYRLLEGGADVTEVYTFTLVNYLAIGATVRF
jgi:hypothetical protein